MPSGLRMPSWQHIPNRPHRVNDDAVPDLLKAVTSSGGLWHELLSQQPSGLSQLGALTNKFVIYVYCQRIPSLMFLEASLNPEPTGLR